MVGKETSDGVGPFTELSLFSGAGGGLLATKWLLGWRTVCYVEKEPYCQAVLEARIRDGLLDDAPIWDDVRTFDGRPWRGKVDCVSGGFPCQPFSYAGRMLADMDPRNCWPDTLRIVRQIRPGWVFLENVPGLLSARHGYFGRVLGGLAELGFDARWGVLSAAGSGAPHIRKRLWVVAYSERFCGERWRVAEDLAGEGRAIEGEAQERQRGGDAAVDSGAVVADAERNEQCEEPNGTAHGCKQPTPRRHDTSRFRNDVSDPSIAPQRPGRWKQRPGFGTGEWGSGSWFEVEPDVGRVVDGMAHRVAMLRALGNGQVPAVVARAWRELST